MIAPRLSMLALLASPSLLACGDSGRASAGDSTDASSITQMGITLTNGGSATTPTSDGSASDSAGSSGSSSSSADTGNPVSDSNSNSNSNSGGAKFDLGATPDAGTGCAGGGDIDTSYIWIPSTSDGWVVKINTRTLIEEARYLTGPSGGSESVSRTAVSGDGRFAVVNARGTGRSTAFAASLEDCKDQNGDGMITTSTGPGDVKPWMGDECMAWTLVHGAWDGGNQHGPRGISWTSGDWDEATCSFINQKVWLGYSGAGNTAHFIRLDGPTGAVEQDLLAPNWNGSGYAPYGGALDKLQRPWFTGLRGELARLETAQNPITITRIPQPGNIQSYGMTVDPDGNPWMGGCSGPVSTYDVATSQWITIAGTNACHRGMAVDHNFHVWVASNGPCGLVEIDGKTRTLVAQHQLAQCSTPIGVSVDVDGFVWLVDQEGWAWKIDTANVGAMQQIPVQGSHYVYSDMTGGQLKSVSPPAG